MKTMKRFISMLLCLVLVCLSLSACGKESQQEGGKAQEGETEIKWWISYSTVYSAYFDPMIEQFNKENEGKYHVTMLYNGGDADLRSKVATTEQADLPNLIIGTPMATAYFSEQDNIIPVQTFLDKDDDDWTSKIFAGIREGYCTNDGTMIGVPLGVSCVGYFVNTEILKKAGYTVEDVTSYEKVGKIAIDIKSKGLADYGMSYYYSKYEMIDAITLEGLHFFDNDNGHSGAPTQSLMKSGATYQGIKKYLDIFVDTYKSNAAYSYTADLNSENIPKFVQGDIAILGATSAYAQMILELQPDFEWEFVSTLPLTDNAPYLGEAMAEGHGIYLVDNGNEAAAQGAYEFLKFLSKVENQVQWCTHTGYMPYTEEAYSNEEYQTWLKENFPSAIPLKDTFLKHPEGLLEPYTYLDDVVQTACGICLTYMFTDPNRDVDEVIQWAHESMEEAIEIEAIRK